MVSCFVRFCCVLDLLGFEFGFGFGFGLVGLVVVCCYGFVDFFVLVFITCC